MALIICSIQVALVKIGIGISIFSFSDNVVWQENGGLKNGLFVTMLVDSYTALVFDYWNMVICSYLHILSFDSLV